MTGRGDQTATVAARSRALAPALEAEPSLLGSRLPRSAAAGRAFSATAVFIAPGNPAMATSSARSNPVPTLLPSK